MMRRAQIMLTGRYTSYIDDALQNAYISIAQNIFTVRTRVACNKRRAFCVKVVANKCIDIIRQTKSEIQSLDDIEYELKASAPDPLDEVVIAEGYHRLMTAIEDLDDGYKATLKYKLIDGLSDSEIAALLGISAKNVNVRTFRAKKKLREALGKAGNIPPEMETIPVYALRPHSQGQLKALSALVKPLYTTPVCAKLFAGEKQIL